MPKIFAKGAKFNVIEYGQPGCIKKELESFKTAILAFFKKWF